MKWLPLKTEYFLCFYFLFFYVFYLLLLPRPLKPRLSVLALKPSLIKLYAFCKSDRTVQIKVSTVQYVESLYNILLQPSYNFKGVSIQDSMSKGEPVQKILYVNCTGPKCEIKVGVHHFRKIEGCLDGN